MTDRWTHVAVVGVLCVALSSFPTAEASRRERHVSSPYRMTGGGAILHLDDGRVTTDDTKYLVDRRERWLSVSIEDDSGLVTAGRIEIGEEVIEFCSESDRIAVQPGATVRLMAITGYPCDGSPSVATEGEFHLTFSR